MIGSKLVRENAPVARARSGSSCVARAAASIPTKILSLLAALALALSLAPSAAWAQDSPSAAKGSPGIQDAGSAAGESAVGESAAASQDEVGAPPSSVSVAAGEGGGDESTASKGLSGESAATAQGGDSLAFAYAEALGEQVAPEEEVPVNPAAEHPDVGASWPGYANGGAGAEVSNVPTPVENGTLDWTYALLTSEEAAAGASASVSDPLIVGGKVYLVTGATTYDASWSAHSSLARLAVIDPETGKVVKQVTLGASMDSTCRPIYASGIVIVPLSNGSLQAVSASTLETLWFVRGAAGAQSLSTLTVKDGYVYAASVDSFDMSYLAASGTLKRFNLLTGAVSGAVASEDTGYYWAGGAAVGGYFAIADDAGNVSVYTEDLSTRMSTLALGAPVRSSLMRSGGYLYAVSTDGVLHKLSVDAEGAVSEAAQAKIAAKSTSTVTLSGAYAYAGGATDAGAGVLSVVKLDDMTVTQITQADGKALRGEVKSAPLVSVQADGTYVYFTCNGAEGEWPAYTAGGGVYCYRTGDAQAASLYEPEAGKANWCLASVVTAPDGSLFYTNDSGYLFKVLPRPSGADDPVDPDPYVPDPEDDPDAPDSPSKKDATAKGNTVAPARKPLAQSAAAQAAESGAEAETQAAKAPAQAKDASASSNKDVAQATGADAPAADSPADVGALNPFAVAGIAVGALALAGVLLWLLLARRKRDDEQDGGSAA